ncbi:MAG TPA: autotransporter-associated beta strand repeat-containing protein, partial [Bacteroidia bacterium]|nr:autotransporter-associated beta strand repeat-containing protein [Bacteroidia bacterium]
MSGSGNRTIDAASGPFTLGTLNWNNTTGENDSLRNGTLNFNSAGGVSTFTYNGSAGGNLQIRNGASIQAAAGQTLNINNASSAANSRINFTTDGAGGTISGSGTIVYNDTSGLDGNLLRGIRFQILNTGFSGTFRLESGTLEIYNTGAVFGTGTLELNGGQVLSDNNAYNLSNDVRVNGGFVFTGTKALTLSGTTTLGAPSPTITIDNTSQPLTLSGVVAGEGFTKMGAGTLVVNNTANTFSGPVNINVGEVEFTSNGALGNSTSIAVDGGRLSFRGSFAVDPGHSIFVGDGAGTSISTPGGSSVITYNGIIANKPGEIGSWAKQGGGTLALGGANTFTGSVTVNNGTLRLDNLAALATASSVVVDSSVNASTLQLNVPGTNTWQIGTGAIILHNGGTLRQLSGSESDIALIAQTIQLSGTGGTINAPGDSRIYVQGDIVGGGTLIKSGGGELRFTSTPKTYTGVTQVNNGRLRIDTTGIPTGTSAINLNGGNLRFGQAGTRVYSLGAGGSAPVNITGVSSIEHSDLGHATLTNPIVITGAGNFRSREDGALFEFSGPITGNGTLSINEGTGGNPVQAGTIYLSGNASAFAGNVNVLQSTLHLGENTTLGANAFTLNVPATLMVGIASESLLGAVSATTATLAAGSVITTKFSTGPTGGVHTYDIIATTGGVTDNGAVAKGNSVMQLSLQNAANTLSLVANVNYAGFGNLGFNAIQTAVGDYLNDATTGSALSLLRGQALNSATDAEIASFYESIAGEEYGSMMDTTLFHGQEQLRSITRYAPHLQNRFGLRDSLGVRPADGSLESPDWNLFSDLRVQRGSQARTTELGGFDSSGQA